MAALAPGCDMPRRGPIQDQGGRRSRRRRLKAGRICTLTSHSGGVQIGCLKNHGIPDPRAGLTVGCSLVCWNPDLFIPSSVCMFIWSFVTSTSVLIFAFL